MIALFRGRIDTPGYALAGIDLKEELYQKHLKEGMSHEEIKMHYIQKYLSRFKKK